METDKKNPFLSRRNVEEAPLHASDNFAERPTIKSFSLYQTDLERIEAQRDKFRTWSRKKLNDSLVMRVAVAYLAEASERGGDRFEKDIRRLINENR